MRKLITALCLLALAFTVFAEPIVLAVNSHPYTKHQLIIDTDDIAQYRKLANRIGLDYDHVYGYREFSEAKIANSIGTAGNYDFLLLSTGGNAWNAEDDLRAQKSPLYWESIYLSNHNMTLIMERQNVNETPAIKLLKLAPGRVEDLHKR